MTLRGPRTALTILLASLLAACGGGNPAPSPSGAASAPELSELTVGTLPIVDVAPVHIAITEGLFAAEGLTVTTEVMQGGAAAIPALQGGDLHVAYGAWPSFLIANSRGIPLRAVADGTAAAPGFSVFMAAPGSELAGNPSGMEGARVALNTLGNIGELVLRETLADAGLTFDDVTAVELPFPEMASALLADRVDVIWASEPGVTTAGDVGAVPVIDSYVDEMAGFPVAGYFVTADFAERYPRTVAAFARALAAAVTIANDDPDAVAEIVQTYTELPASVVERIAFPAYRGELEVESLERVYAELRRFEMIDAGLEVRSLLLGDG